MFQRVDAEIIRRTSRNTTVVINKLNAFIKTTAIYASSTLRRTNDALTMIKQLVVNDISALVSIVSSYKHAYDSLLAAKIDHLLYFLDSLDSHLDYLILRLEKRPLDLSIHGATSEYRGIMDYGWNAIVLSIGVFDILRLSLLSIKDINTMVAIADLDESVMKTLPSTLWPSIERWRTCNDLIKRESNTYKNTVRFLYQVLRNWQEFSTSNEWPTGLTWKIPLRKNRIGTLKSCVREYRDSITNAANDLHGIQSATEDTLNTATNFDTQAFEDSIKADLKAISASGPWLHEQIERYGASNVSQLDLAEKVLGENMQEDLVRYMESVLFKTDLDAVFKLKTEAQRLKTQIQKWYVAGLAAVSSLPDYFEKDQVESKVRNISLWRKPVLDMRTWDVLKFTYNSDEAWRTWPISVPLGNLVVPGGSHYISDILDDYMAGISDALYEVQHRSLTTKEGAVVALNELWKELEHYKQHTHIDDSFVR